MHVVMLLYPGLTQLDLTGPFEVLTRFRELTIELVWKTLHPVTDGNGLRLLPDATFETCRKADILFVPGGPGQTKLMNDVETLEFLRSQAEDAEYVTSVCTGSLVLAAAGLLKGCRATSHWLSIDQLFYFGVTPVMERVVVDGSRITGAGVTSGIDFALTLAAKLFGEERARGVQLSMEYDPKPPFASGSPTTAFPETVERARELAAPFQAQRERIAREAAEHLRNIAQAKP